MAQDMERALGALRDLTRRDILLRFYADRAPRTIDEVARAAGIHRSVAFEHLERLVGLGYLETERRRGFPGKPAKVYRLTAGPVQISYPIRRYDLLAEALARAFQGLGDAGSQAVRQAGRDVGSSLAIASPTRSVATAIEPLVELGGEYEVAEGGEIRCSSCLFAEVCRRAPVICGFHAGILEGLLERSGLGAAVQAQGFRDPAGCSYSMENTQRQVRVARAS